MNPERWQKIKQIFSDALEREPLQRPAFLAEACSDDPEVRAEVEKLLASYDSEFMAQPAIGEAADLLVDARASLQTGQRLGRYRITQSLGAGGMGEVYLAYDTELERDVALKVLKANSFGDPHKMRRFIREAKTASGLNHPNIITIYEVGEASGSRFIATEYIKGETLRQRMQREPLSLPDGFEIMVQVATALAAAHHAKVVHRDIKPENIMLRPDGVVKVLDFGLAKLTEPAPAPSSSDEHAATRLQIDTAPGLIMGTVTYMSPEQARGKEVDLRTDIWSFGVVLYELIAGQLPFMGETTSDVIAAILTSDPISLGRLVPGTPESLQEIVARCLNPDQEGRYQTAADLLIDLKARQPELEFQPDLQRADAGHFGARAERRSTAGLGSEAVTQIAKAPTLSSETSRTNQFRTRRKVVVSALLVLLLGLTVLAYYLIKYKGANDGAAFTGNDAVIESMAVLPFANASQDPNAEYLSDGISESLINNLSQVPNLKVTSRNSTLRYKGSGTDVQKAGKELNVRAVLAGDVKQINNQVVINVELIDIRDNHQIWGGRYVRDFADILKVQNEITQEVSTKLRLKLTSALQQQIARHSTDNPEAYREYLKGRFYSLQYSVEGHAKALEHLNRAIEIDPTYALAYAGVADAYTTADDWLLPPSEALSKARAAADKALALDNELAEAWSARGHARLHEWDKGAIEDLNRSIELAPNTLTNQLWLGEYYMIFDVEKSIQVLEKAATVDPLSALPPAFIGFDYYMLRQPEKSFVYAKKAIELDPMFYQEHAYEAWIYVFQGDFTSAANELSKTPPEAFDVFALATRGMILGRQGKRAEAQKVIAQLKKLSETQYVSPFNFALVYNALDDRDQTFFWLDKAFADHSEILGFIRTLPEFDPIHSDPRYAALLARIGFTQ